MAATRSTSKIAPKWVRQPQKYFLKFLHSTGFPPAPLAVRGYGNCRATASGPSLQSTSLDAEDQARGLGPLKMPRPLNYILRRMHIENGMPPGDALVSLRDRRLYDVVQMTVAESMMIAMSLNTRFFLPEMLGMNLFIEAKGVGGYYLITEQAAERAGKKWTALSMRLHNAIDNYASGHTHWSVAAIQAFMARVQDAGPRVRAEQWHRIWRLWRFNELRDYGTKDQQHVLEQLLGSVATESFVPSEL